MDSWIAEWTERLSSTAYALLKSFYEYDSDDFILQEC